ncbi:MAG: DUF4149 domain-containing protein [Pseudomonadota bacterium]
MTLLPVAALLLSALLFGGTVLYSFGFAAFLFMNLPAEQAGPLIRKAFPHFYLWVMGTAALAAVPHFWIDPVSAGLLLGVALTTLPTRQILMPAINAATDSGSKVRFKRLHTLSVFVTLVHIVIVAYVLLRLLA